MSVPQLQRVGSSVNNDAAYTLAFAAVLLLLARVATGDVRPTARRATGVAVGVAMLTKGFALVLPLAVGLAFARRRPRAAAGRGPPGCCPAS